MDALTALTELARAELARVEASGTGARGGADTVVDTPAPVPGGHDPRADDPPATPPVDTTPDTTSDTAPDTTPDSGADPGGLSGRSLADVATSLWRLRTRLDRMEDAPRAVVRNLETAWDALADAGVEIKDHAGEPFDVGLAMSVLAYQPTPGLHREQIIETVRPGVYLGERSIQMAEVIVGTPDPPPAAREAEATEETRRT